MSIRTGSGTTSSWITPGDGELWGYPTALGTYSVTVTLTDEDDATATTTFELRVKPLYADDVPAERHDRRRRIRRRLRVLGGTGPYTAAQVGGQMAGRRDAERGRTLW